MSHAAAAHHDVMADDNIRLRSGGAIGTGLVVLGVVAVIATFAVGASQGLFKQALAAYHVGAMASLAVCLGAMFWVMAFHLVMSGWSVSIRRQFENAMTLVPVFGVLAVAGIAVDVFFMHGRLMSWMNDTITRGDALYSAKVTWLQPLRWGLFALLYLFIWVYLSQRLWWYSTEQDRSGNPLLSNKARFTSAWGMPVFALSLTFAAFDWLMSVDYRWFSTMWGVYYFAGAALSGMSAMILVLAALRRRGRLEGAVTNEHLHDMSKLVFGFIVFWGYIGFGQYFLIWYSNIPEETSFMLARKTQGWNTLSTFLVWGHFAIPWYILLWKFVRRSWALMSVVCAWVMVLEIADMYWIIRPVVYGTEPDPVRLGLVWLDVLGAIGVPLILAGLLIRRAHSGVLMPTKDPRLPEALHHRNYV
jgi:hypothetical protein